MKTSENARPVSGPFGCICICKCKCYMYMYMYMYIYILYIYIWEIPLVEAAAAAWSDKAFHDQQRLLDRYNINILKDNIFFQGEGGHALASRTHMMHLSKAKDELRQPALRHFPAGPAPSSNHIMACFTSHLWCIYCLHACSSLCVSEYAEYVAIACSSLQFSWTALQNHYRQTHLQFEQENCIEEQALRKHR